MTNVTDLCDDRKGRGQRSFSCAILILFSFPLLGSSQPALNGTSRIEDRVLVVINANSSVSRAVSQNYMRLRGIPNQLTVTCADAAKNRAAETMAFPAFQKEIEAPLSAFLD